MNGNITKEGITARPGMDAPRGPGGLPELRCRAANAPGGRQAPRLHDPEWKDAFKHATTAGRSTRIRRPSPVPPDGANRVAPGYRRSEGMKKYVWSATSVPGGKPFSGVLPHPPSNTGAFQNESVHDQQPPPGSMTVPEILQGYSRGGVQAARRGSLRRGASRRRSPPAAVLPIPPCCPTATSKRRQRFRLPPKDRHPGFNTNSRSPRPFVPSLT